MGGRNNRVRKQRYERLHRLLWGEDEVLRNVIFTEKTVKVPNFMEDGTFNECSFTYKELSLDLAIGDFIRDKADLNPSDWSNLLPCNSPTLLVRTSYVEMLHRIREYERSVSSSTRIDGERSRFFEGAKRKRQQDKYAFIITRHPGIGKTFFLSLVLVDRLLRSEPTILQVGSAGAVQHLLFDTAGVRYISELNDSDPVFGNTDVWALIDQKPQGDIADAEDIQWLQIVTSSPKYENYKLLVKNHSALKYLMSAWSWCEIVAALSVIDHPLEGLKLRTNKFSRHAAGDTERLRKQWSQYEKYGPIARLQLRNLSMAQNTKDLEDRLADYDQELDLKCVNLLSQDPSVFAGSQFSADSSHTVLLLQPLIEPGSKYTSIGVKKHLSIVTSYIGWKIGLLAGNRANYKGGELFHFLQSNSMESSAASSLFEGRGHGVFHVPGRWECRLLTPVDELKSNYRKYLSSKTIPRAQEDIVTSAKNADLKAAKTGILSIEFKGCPEQVKWIFQNLAEFSEQTRASTGSQYFNDLANGVYFRPIQNNLGAIDALMISKDVFGQPRAFLFQLTVSRKHPMGASELVKAWEALPEEVRRVPPALILVVPANLSNTYKRQSISEGKHTGTDMDPALWPQFVLGLTDNELWNIDSIGSPKAGDGRRVFNDS